MSDNETEDWNFNKAGSIFLGPGDFDRLKPCYSIAKQLGYRDSPKDYVEDLAMLAKIKAVFGHKRGVDITFKHVVSLRHLREEHRSRFREEFEKLSAHPPIDLRDED